MVKPKYKIAMIGQMLSRGGAERVQARLSFFFEKNNIEVHHIIVIDNITYDYTGTLFNMGKLKSKRNGLYNKLKRLRALKHYLDEHKFDFLIDFRVKNNFLQEYIIANWIYKSPYIMSIRSFETLYYFPKRKTFATKIFKKAYGFVAVTKAIQAKIIKDYNCENTTTIYNPLDFNFIERQVKEQIPIENKYILGVGRMHEIKQFNHLIKAYAESLAIKNGIKLVILGNGQLLPEYKALVGELDIKEYVEFIPPVTNVFPFFKNAYFTALTSKNEGFPNVLIESLASGTPVVSYDCESGPREIITDRENGLLVNNQNIISMTTAINEMINNESLYDFCKSNAKQSVQHLSLDKIGNDWMQFLGMKG